MFRDKWRGSIFAEFDELRWRRRTKGVSGRKGSKANCLNSKYVSNKKNTIISRICLSTHSRVNKGRVLIQGFDIYEYLCCLVCELRVLSVRLLSACLVCA